MEEVKQKLLKKQKKKTKKGKLRSPCLTHRVLHD